MFNQTKHLSERTDEILTMREEELLSADKLIADARAHVLAASESMNVATINGDVKAYKDAKAEHENAQAELEMLVARRDLLQDHALVTEDEYKGESEALMDALSSYCAENRSKVNKAIKIILSAAEEEAAILDEANAALLRWQRDVYRNADRYFANGTFNASPVSELKFNDYLLSQFVVHMSYHDYMRRYFGTDSKTDVSKFSPCRS